MKITVKGKGAETLSKNEFVAAGGQGDIYIKGGTAYKIYQDPKNSIPYAKFQELRGLVAPNIIKPENIILNERNIEIGYTMKAVPDSYVLCQLFPKSFRTRNSLTPDKVIHLVRKLRESIAAIHTEKILVVDLNENNFLVQKDFKEIFCIDVDSYQTPSFAANALMESVRDRHAKIWTEGTDWFSFAIVSFQMFRGIHPYKGRHPKYASLDERMIHNLSILNSGVTYPQNAVLDESVVPQSYRDWYRAVLEDGKRIAPPTDLTNTINVITKKIKIISGNLFDVIPLNLFHKTLAGNVISLYESADTLVCITDQSIYTSKGYAAGFNQLKPMFVGFTPKYNIPFAANIIDGKLNVFSLQSGGTPIQMGEALAESIMECDGRLYYKNGMNLLELVFIESGPNMIRATPYLVAQVAQSSTMLFSGIVIQNILGSIFANIFPAHKLNAQIRLSQLDGYKILSAKCDGRILMVIAEKSGKYDRFVFSLDKSYKVCDTRIEKDVPYEEVNFVVLPQGICVSIENGKAVIFNENAAKILDDPILHDIELMKQGGKVCFAKNGEFFQLRTK